MDLLKKIISTLTGLFIVEVIILFFIDWKVAVFSGIILVVVSMLIQKKIDSIEKSKNKEQEDKKLQELNQTYGSENAKKIHDGVVTIDMTKAMVSEVYGNPFNKQEKVTKDGTVETFYYQPYTYRNSTKYKKYAIFKNDVLTEFGDVER